MFNWCLMFPLIWLSVRNFLNIHIIHGWVYVQPLRKKTRFSIGLIKKHVHHRKHQYVTYVLLRLLFWSPVFIDRDVYHNIEPLDPEKLNVFRTVREITGERYHQVYREHLTASIQINKTPGKLLDFIYFSVLRIRKLILLVHMCICVCICSRLPLRASTPRIDIRRKMNIRWVFQSPLSLCSPSGESPALSSTVPVLPSRTMKKRPSTCGAHR